MKPLRLHLAYKNIKRLECIISTLIKHGFYPVMESLHLVGLGLWLAFQILRSGKF
ncbi:MAG: hypothetical protein HY883_05250 [Deltaproteobacteria bacterium]|nr:hypothetical protein [Deltaproteobacteria bacterium]